MSFLPDIIDGKVVEEQPAPKLYTPPKTFNIRREEERLSDLNNLGRPMEREDFSNSPALINN